MVEESAARELEMQQLKVQNTSLAEKQSEMQKDLLLGQQREEEMVEERAAGELELQQLQVYNSSLLEKQAKLEEEVVNLRLQADRITDEQFIANMPALTCDANTARVENDLMEVGGSEKNPKRKRTD